MCLSFMIAIAVALGLRTIGLFSLFRVILVGFAIAISLDEEGTIGARF